MASEMGQVEGTAGPARAGRGGYRAGSGRKPGGYIAKRSGDRRYARALLATLMSDEAQPMAIRAAAAAAVLVANRGAGREPKPKGPGDQPTP